MAAPRRTITQLLASLYGGAGNGTLDDLQRIVRHQRQTERQLLRVLNGVFLEWWAEALLRGDANDLGHAFKVYLLRKTRHASAPELRRIVRGLLVLLRDVEELGVIERSRRQHIQRQARARARKAAGKAHEVQRKKAASIWDTVFGLKHGKGLATTRQAVRRYLETHPDDAWLAATPDEKLTRIQSLERRLREHARKSGRVRR